MRLPSWALLVATNWPLYGLTKKLFGREAALWALFAFNANAYFLLLPDGYILPDAALLPLLATAAWAIVESIFTPDASQRRTWGLWLTAGGTLGLAGLAKYTAVFAPVGLFGFFLFSAEHRRWFVRPEPYVATGLALAIFSPALIWNAENHWVSFAFQSTRAAVGGTFGADAAWQILNTVLEQAASLTPWVLIPVVAGLAQAGRGRAQSGERLLLWLVLPTLLLFALLPISGKRAIPHWFNSGWLFAFPLAGQWLAQRHENTLKVWATTSVALAAALLAFVIPLVIVGPANMLPRLGFLAHDPTVASFDWPDLRSSHSWRGDGSNPPDFVIVDHWRVGGRAGVALGPSVPVCAFTDDPRGLAFACDSRKFLGRDALIVLPAKEAAQIYRFGAYFERIEAAETIAIGRLGVAERQIVLARAHNLLRPYTLPYGPYR